MSTRTRTRRKPRQRLFPEFPVDRKLPAHAYVRHQGRWVNDQRLLLAYRRAFMADDAPAVVILHEQVGDTYQPVRAVALTPDARGWSIPQYGLTIE